jgi:superfamily II DNA or RNA helicase
MNNENPNIYIGTYQSLEKYTKEFFKQFQIVCVDEGHMAKAKTINSILEKTFVNAQYRFGVSGTFPVEESCEILSIQSVLGPIITEVTATELMKKDIITPMNIKAVVLNHATGEMNDRLNYIKKMGAGADAFRYEKEYIQNSDKRLDFIKKLVAKCDTNTLLLFHSIEYGTKIYNKLKEELPGKDFYYIDGEVNNKQREIIKKEMEKTKEKVEWTILNFGEYELELKSDTKIPLSDGGYKLASDITPDDDINDDFIKKYKK